MRFRLTYAVVLAFAAIYGCEKSPPALVIDTWWNIGFAKTSCEQAAAWQRQNGMLIAKWGCDRVTACPDMLPRAQACAGDPEQQVRMFEYELSGQFAGSAECASVQVVRFEGPKTSVSEATSKALEGEHWTLMIDFNPGSSRHGWSVVRAPLGGKPSQVFEGSGDASEMAKKICTIVAGRGALVQR